MADLLTYAVSAAPVVDSDVVTREMSVVVNGVTLRKDSFNATVVDLGVVTVPQDSNVELVLVDIDDAGNRSEPATMLFTAVDTLPPVQPGAFSVTLVSEAPAVEPVPEKPEEDVDGGDVVNES